MPANRSRVSTTKFAKTFYKIPALMVYRVRCGKASCHCATDAGHGPYAFLHWRDAVGRQRRRYVLQGEVDAVLATLAARRAEQRRARLEAMAALAWLRINRKMITAIEREHRS